jgi:hypothetical protein
MHIDWSGLGEVGAISLVAGVGIVVLFSLGLTALDWRTPRHAATNPSSSPRSCPACVFSPVPHWSVTVFTCS